ncbi:molybdopterin converting factor subunit 1 [Alteribacter populi]|uniref:molybdopterin converting factor subunit 1 n=1 Tax=Alteribacter populi TaxID=2011011 RepID=UPI000BBB133E|nr:molybdopterin converting factor subunit 1 [Alteribacter populi]
MIEVLFFAELEEKAGTRRLTVEKNELTIEALRTHLVEMNSQLTGVKNAMAAVNEEYAEEATVVRDGDTVAFIPPVSGG